MHMLQEWHNDQHLCLTLKSMLAQKEVLGDLNKHMGDTGNKAYEQHQPAAAEGTKKSVKSSRAGSKLTQKLVEAGIDVMREWDSPDALWEVLITEKAIDYWAGLPPVVR